MDNSVATFLFCLLFGLFLSGSVSLLPLFFFRPEQRVVDGADAFVEQVKENDGDNDEYKAHCTSFILLK